MKALELELENVKGQAKKTVEELEQQMSVKVAELETERKERTSEGERVKALELELEDLKKRAKETVEELEQQMSAKVAELETERKERTSEGERVKALELELEDLKMKAKEKVEELNQKMSAKIAELETERNASASEAELNLHQIHQVQEELQHYFSQLRSKDELIKEMAGLREEAQKTVEELKQQMSAKISELETERNERASGARRLKPLEEEAKLNLLQLHQVQGELEHYFQKSKCSEEIVEAQREQLIRSRSILCKLIRRPDLELQPIESINVEVLPPENTQLRSNGSVQTEALLDSYKTSLGRATDLLKEKYRS